MANCKLSIITITFNDPNGLLATGKSLLPLQNSPLSWEWVIIDSSAEKNEPIIQDFQHKLPMQRKICPAKGIYPAMNEGISYSSGQYLWFLNGGDRLFHREALEEILKSMDERQASWCAGSVAIFDSGQMRYLQPAPRSPFQGILGFHRFCHQGIIYSKSMLKESLQYNTKYRWAADYDLHFSLYKNRSPYLKNNSVLAAFEQGGSSSDFLSVMKEMRKVQREHGALSWGLHTLVWYAVLFKITIYKFLKNSFFGPTLQQFRDKLYRK